MQTTNTFKGNATAIAHDLLRSFNEDRIDLQHMLDCLQKERKALEERDHKTLETFATQKTELSKKLEARNAQREKRLGEHNFDTNTKSWRPMISKLETQSGLPVLSAWNDIEALLRECRDLLKINEKVVGNMQNNVNQFLNALRGETGAGQTYSASGKANIYSEHQSITNA